ncbi:MAG: indole-3-glycerol phosphate synthase TrpC [Tannerellaceae bacterium]|jgi:indole-3-glycerol phosphate synthase|nr:indole-3-glycerol phosphate synthase TrpC [Tannerellaceae bacterium]
MKDILNAILESKRAEVRRRQNILSLSDLASDVSARTLRTPLSLRQAIEASPHGIIAEFKRRSPSKCSLYNGANVGKVVSAYEQSGASACSILTDEPFFGGTLDDLVDARCAVQLPLLRKDFIIDEYQLYEARLWGADAVLLIASAISRLTCYRLAEKARSLGLEVLLEIHNREELDYINPFVDILGVNNRNLSSFVTDVETSLSMADELRSTGCCMISESGIHSAEVVRQLQQAGFRGFLIGELFMATKSPGKRLSDLIAELAR